MRYYWPIAQMIVINRVGDDEGVTCDSASALWHQDFRQLPFFFLSCLFFEITQTGLFYLMIMKMSFYY